MNDRRPLHDFTDAELRDAITRSAERTTYAYADYRGELERRAAERQARWDRTLSLVSIGIAIVALLVASLRPA